MSGTPLIRSVMTPFPYAVGLDEPLATARRMMSLHRVRHLPVKDRDQLVGLISDRDIKLSLGPYLDLPADGDRALVRHASVANAYVVETTTPLQVVAAEMARRRIGSALVTKDGRLAGIFTATDACRCLARVLGGASVVPDEAA